MDTKVFDDDSQYAGIRNLYRRRSIQFLTARLIYERHKDQLKENPMVYKLDDFMDF